MILHTPTLCLNTAHLALVSLGEQPVIVLKSGHEHRVSKQDAEFVIKTLGVNQPSNVRQYESFDRWWSIRRLESAAPSSAAIAHEAWCAARQAPEPDKT